MAFRKTTARRKPAAKRNATPRATTRRSATKRGATVRVKVWSASEISQLRKKYRNTTNTKIAKSLGRTVASVRAKAGSLSLKKNKNFLSMVAKTAGNGGMKTRKSTARKTVARKASSMRGKATKRTAAKRNAPKRKTSARKSSTRRATSSMKRKATRRR
ncbi:hypothetical protein JYU19_00700 [bacterium AH-315-J21]|nr:hypothetical protein [bacterium AH-315-J21]